MGPDANVRPLTAAGAMLGIGMGGFVDGILFHQILQLHNMLSNRVLRDSLVNEQINMFWDGLFHAFTWTMVAIGIGMLWRAVRHAEAPRSGKVLWGGLLLGWGIFNVVEGTIDHQILQLHHVVQNGNHLLWDLVFLAIGVLLAGAGWRLVQVGASEVARSTQGG